jgi:hypothetical protein
MPVINLEIGDRRETMDIGQNSFKMAYTVRSPSRLPVTEVVALIDDRQKAVEEKPKPSQDTLVEFHRDLPDRDIRISLQARTGASEWGKALVIVVLRKGAPPAPTIEPNLYAVVIGVGEYNDVDAKRLESPAKDAEEFARSCSSNRVVFSTRSSSRS